MLIVAKAPFWKEWKTMKKAILLVSYGVASKALWEKSLGMLEEEIRRDWPEWHVCQAFTGRRILEKYNAQGYEMSNETQALNQLVEQGFEKIIVLPTHLTFGSEYSKVMTAIETTEPKSIATLPLLGSEISRRKVAEVLIRETDLQEEEAILYVGHGSKQDESAVYEGLEKELHASGQTAAIVGTLESIDQVLTRINTRKVTVAPLLLTAGKHALQDICGEGKESVVSRLRAGGREVCFIEKGLVEYESIRRIYLEQLEELVQSFNL